MVVVAGPGESFFRSPVEDVMGGLVVVRSKQ